MSTTVIVSAYNQPERLSLVLTALANQTRQPDEVIVADDGSDPENLIALRRRHAGSPFRLVHIWQPDEKFRLARSRNNAIHAAQGDTIALLDQDTIPHHGWLASFADNVRPGRVCTGYVLWMTEAQSKRLTRENVGNKVFETWPSVDEYRQLDSLQMKYEFYAFMRRVGLGIKGRPAIAFGNACAMKVDLLKVNGFDEEYIGWGQEDDDLGWRLYLAGIRPVPLVNRALVSHIWHETNRPDDWETGANIERYRRRRKVSRCEQGLDSHPHSDVEVTLLSD